MITVLLAVALLGGAASIAAGLAFPRLRALAVAGGAVLVLVIFSIVWLALLGLGVIGVVDTGSPIGRVEPAGRILDTAAAPAAGRRVRALLRLQGPARVMVC